MISLRMTGGKFTGKYYDNTSERCDNILSNKRYSKFRIQKNIVSGKASKII